MATIYGGADGQILRLLVTPFEEAQHGPPAGAVSTLVFDPATNAALLEGLRQEITAYRLITGRLERAGQPQPINPPSQAWQDFQTARQLWAKLAADQNLTTAELRILLRYLLRIIFRLMQQID